jgi:hypothetical protein
MEAEPDNCIPRFYLGTRKETRNKKIIIKADN